MFILSCVGFITHTYDQTQAKSYDYVKIFLTLEALLYEKISDEMMWCEVCVFCLDRVSISSFKYHHHHRVLMLFMYTDGINGNIIW